MPDHFHTLPVGHLLGEYRIDDVLGSSDFGITYLAWDTQLEKRVAIKEYLPIELALRTDAATVHPISTTHQADYQWRLDRFLDEARILARLEHPHLNKVHRFFEANGTAYMVLEYIEGETLAARLKREGQLDAARLRRLLDELLAGLEQVHAAGLVHCDIKPANVMLRPDGAAVLLDLGAVRRAIGQRSNGLAPVLTPGYAAIEQYEYDQGATNVGPWTDLYALGMVAYRCLSNIREAEIPDAVARAKQEYRGEPHPILPPAAEVDKGHYDTALLRAVDWATEVYVERRPRNAAAMRQALAGDDKPAPAPAAPEATSQPPKPRSGKIWRTVSLSALAIIAVAATATPGWPIVQEQMDWWAVRCGNVVSVQGYLDAYPDGRHEAEAEACLVAAEPEIGLFIEVFGHTPSPDAESAKCATDLHNAAAKNMPGVARFLLDVGANVNAKENNGWTPLHVAAGKNARETAELLIARGANVHAKDNDGGTPLHEAAGRNARETAELLIARGANVHAKPSNGWTPLHIAAWGNAREAAELLIAHGANVNAKDDDDWTPLHFAAVKNAREVAELLIVRRANFNAKTDNDWTPLHFAAWKNARETAELLIARGANVNAKNDDGSRPWDLAESEELKRLLG